MNYYNYYINYYINSTILRPKSELLTDHPIRGLKEAAVCLYFKLLAIKNQFKIVHDLL